MTKAARVQTSRRRFLRTGAGAALAGAMASRLASPSLVSAADGAKTLKIALIGCGGRGTGAAMNALSADPHVELAAMGDLFEDRLQNGLTQLKEKAPEKIKVAPENCFLGFDAYQKVVETDGFRILHSLGGLALVAAGGMLLVRALDWAGVEALVTERILRPLLG